jgi:hypothetical protein
MRKIVAEIKLVVETIFKDDESTGEAVAECISDDLQDMDWIVFECDCIKEEITEIKENI